MTQTQTDSTEALKRIPTIPPMGPATAKLIEFLRGKGQPGTVVTDEDLSAAAGRNCAVGGDGYNNLHTAIRHLARQNEQVWQRIRGAGAIKCLTAPECVESADADRRGIHRRTKRAIAKLNSIPPDSLPADQIGGMRARAAQLGMLLMCSKPNMTKKLEARQVTDAPDLKRLLEAIA